MNTSGSPEDDDPQVEPSTETKKDSSSAARALRSIPSEARAQASRENGKKGGRPKKIKDLPKGWQDLDLSNSSWLDLHLYTDMSKEALERHKSQGVADGK